MDNSLEKRMRSIERRNMVILAGFCIFGLLLLVAGTSQKGNPETVTCLQLRVVDSSGSTIAMIGEDADGSRGLFIYDDEGRLRLTTIHDAEQSAIYILDSVGTTRIGIAQFAHGGGGVALHGADSKGATVLYHKGEGSLRLFDEEGTVVHQFPEK